MQHNFKDIVRKVVQIEEQTHHITITLILYYKAKSAKLQTKIAEIEK